MTLTAGTALLPLIKSTHQTALNHPDHMKTYHQEEIDNNVILGPYKDNPIKNLHTSPFMTQGKPNSDKRRVIINLISLLGGSVNAGVPTDIYLDTNFVLTCPSVDNITQEVRKFARNAKFSKLISVGLFTMSLLILDILIFWAFIGMITSLIFLSHLGLNTGCPFFREFIHVTLHHEAGGLWYLESY